MQFTSIMVEAQTYHSRWNVSQILWIYLTCVSSKVPLESNWKEKLWRLCLSCWSGPIGFGGGLFWQVTKSWRFLLLRGGGLPAPASCCALPPSSNRAKRFEKWSKLTTCCSPGWAVCTILTSFSWESANQLWENCNHTSSFLHTNCQHWCRCLQLTVASSSSSSGPLWRFASVSSHCRSCCLLVFKRRWLDSWEDETGGVNKLSFWHLQVGQGRFQSVNLSDPSAVQGETKTRTI